MTNIANNPEPFFSVVIPAYNSGNHIAGTLLSVFNQTYENYQIIVSDDGSTDDTIAVVKEVFGRFPGKAARLLINAHEGPGAARNKGIGAAMYEWIAFLDSDDIWLPQKLQKVAEIIDKNRETNVICHNEIMGKKTGNVVYDYANAYNKKVHPFLSFYRRNTLSPSTTTVKKELLVRAGMFDVTLYSAQDYDLWLRLAMLQDLKIAYTEDALSLVIEREDSISSNIELRLECLLKINNKYRRKLKLYSKFPGIESMRYEGRWYAWAGLQLIRRKEISRGITLLIKGIARWPFRFDWLLKMINSKISRVK